MVKGRFAPRLSCDGCIEVHRSQPSRASVIEGTTPTPSHRFRSVFRVPQNARRVQWLSDGIRFWLLPQPLFAKVGLCNGGVWVEHFRPNELACIALHLN